MTTATVIVPTISPDRAASLLASLAQSGGEFETLIVDNGTGSAELDRAAAEVDGAQVLRLESNLGYSRAINQELRGPRERRSFSSMTTAWWIRATWSRSPVPSTLRPVS